MGQDRKLGHLGFLVGWFSSSRKFTFGIKSADVEEDETEDRNEENDDNDKVNAVKILQMKKLMRTLTILSTERLLP